MINLIDLQPGARLQLVGRVTAVVVENMQDGQWVMVRITDAPSDPDTVGDEQLCHSQDVVDLLPAE